MLPIHKYAEIGDIEGIARELALGVSVNELDEYGELTSLGQAAMSKAAGVETLSFLLERGALIHPPPDEYWTSSLWWALVGEDLKKIKFLVQAQPNPEEYQESLDRYINGQTRYIIPMAKLLFEAGGSPSLLGWSGLRLAAALGSKADVEFELVQGGNPNETDEWQRTPWLLSLLGGDLEKVEFLAAVSDRSLRAEFGQTPLLHAIEANQLEVLSWLIEHGEDLNEKDEFGDTPLITAAQQGATECVRILLNAGARTDITNNSGKSAEQYRAEFEEIYARMENPPPPMPLDYYERMSNMEGVKAIARAANMDIARLLIATGDELGEISSDLRAKLLGLEAEGELSCPRDVYEAGWPRRFGKSNPEKMEIPFWEIMVRAGNGYVLIDPPITIDESLENSPAWSYRRFGMSITELPDGRIIEIGGEHEDSYDPHFCIYNEVFVHHGGGNFEIFGYPEDVFPPTDFHSATSVGEFIYIIGSIGYYGARLYGETPVYRLNIHSLVIEKVETTGDKPGWISQHKAVLLPSELPGKIQVTGGNILEQEDEQEVQRSNADKFVLDLSNMVWTSSPEGAG